MTKKIITSYTAFIFMAMMMIGATIALGSEVTGTLSSDTSNEQSTGEIRGTVSSSDSQTSGNLGGTVSSGNGGSSSGGSRGSGGSSSNAPSGTVLGETIDNTQTQTPGFPNAGVAPEASHADQSFWSAVMNFLKSALSF